MRMSRPVSQAVSGRCTAAEQARGSKLCIQTRPNPTCGWILDGVLQLARSRQGGDMQCQAIGLPCREPCTTQRTPFPVALVIEQTRDIQHSDGRYAPTNNASLDALALDRRVRRVADHCCRTGGSTSGVCKTGGVCAWRPSTIEGLGTMMNCPYMYVKLFQALFLRPPSAPRLPLASFHRCLCQTATAMTAAPDRQHPSGQIPADCGLAHGLFGASIVLSRDAQRALHTASCWPAPCSLTTLPPSSSSSSSPHNRRRTMAIPGIWPRAWHHPTPVS